MLKLSAALLIILEFPT